MKSGVTQERAEAELTALVNDSSIVPAGALGIRRRTRAERPHARAHGRLAGVRHGVGAHAAADPARGGVVRAPDRLRQRREPADGAPHRAPRRTVRAHGPRRGTPADRASVADGSGRAVAAGRVARRDARADRDRRHAAARAAIRAATPRRHRDRRARDGVLPRLVARLDAARSASCRRCASAGPRLAKASRCTPAHARTTGDRQGERLRTLLVAAQIAMTLVLLIGAGLLIHSFVRLTSVSPGFESSGRDGVVQTVRVTLPERLYDKPERIHAFARGVLDRIQYLPGVTSASLINSAPFGMMFIQGDFDIEGQPKPTLDAGTPKIDAGYFKTMGIPLLAGREFTARDTADAPKVAIVSERIVREYFPGGPGEALGRRVRAGRSRRVADGGGRGRGHPSEGTRSGRAAHDLRAVPAGPQRFHTVRVVRRAHGHTRQRGRRHPRGNSPRRARSADREHGDDGRSGGGVGGGAAFPDVAAGAVRDDRDADRDVRHLRIDGLRGDAAPPRDRRAHGARRRHAATCSASCSRARSASSSPA